MTREIQPGDYVRLKERHVSSRAVHYSNTVQRVATISDTMVSFEGGNNLVCPLEDVELIDPNEPYEYSPAPGDLLIVAEDKCQGLVVQVTDYRNTSPETVSTNMGSFYLANTVPMDFCALF